MLGTLTVGPDAMGCVCNRPAFNALVAKVAAGIFGNMRLKILPLWLLVKSISVSPGSFPPERSCASKIAYDARETGHAGGLAEFGDCCTCHRNPHRNPRRPQPPPDPSQPLSRSTGGTRTPAGRHTPRPVAEPFQQLYKRFRISATPRPSLSDRVTQCNTDKSLIRLTLPPPHHFVLHRQTARITMFTRQSQQLDRQPTPRGAVYGLHALLVILRSMRRSVVAGFEWVWRGL